jgi:hypothetical protein
MGAFEWFSAAFPAVSPRMRNQIGQDVRGHRLRSNQRFIVYLVGLTRFLHTNGYPPSSKSLLFQWDFRRIEMTKAKFFVAAALLSTAVLAPNLADARHNRHHLHNWGLPYPISFLHNYGPGPQPGTFAYYDGPSTILCRQGAAAYIGQDRRRHPCY